MKLIHCAFLSCETLTGLQSAGTCNLFPQYGDFGLDYKFIDCEAIPISKCPYKLFKIGEIEKQELHQQVNEILSNNRCQRRL